MTSSSRCGTIVLSLLMAACATTTDGTDEPREERVYRTGSNLPQKDHGNVRQVDAIELRDADRRNQQPRHGN